MKTSKVISTWAIYVNISNGNVYLRHEITNLWKMRHN